MEELEENNNAELNTDLSSIDAVSDEILKDTDVEETILSTIEEEKTQDSSTSTAMIEYREIEEPCVALTIIGENRLTNTEVFIKRGFKFSLKAFFSTLVLTIMNMFI